MTELATYQNPAQADIKSQMEFASAVVARPEGAARSLLPDAYRDNPANVLIAVGLGSSMGLSFAESLYRIDVIQGKPAASAELIASNVRRAGHKLRMKVTEEPPSATCTIIRADDPDEPTVITRDMAWARRMGLDGKDNYKKQPSTMLAWRAVSACARLACPEALYGITYTPDELTDIEPSRATVAPATGADRMRQVLNPEPETTAEQVEEPLLLNTSSKLAKAMYAGINDLGIADNERIPFIVSVIDRHIESTKELTEDEARLVLRHIDDIKEPVDAEIVPEPQS